MSKISINILLLALVATLLSACNTAPLSFIETKPIRPIIANDLYPISITAIDGVGNSWPETPVFVGKRQLELIALGGRQVGFPKVKKVDFDVKPCTRYYLLGRRDSPMTQEWELVITDTETIAGCDAKNEILKAQIENEKHSQKDGLLFKEPDSGTLTQQ